MKPLNPQERNLVLACIGIVICVGLLGMLLWYVDTNELNPVWTDQAKITSITSTTDAFGGNLWTFQAVTFHHGNQTVTSECGFEVVGNTIYVSLLGDGKYFQTDVQGTIACQR